MPSNLDKPLLYWTLQDALTLRLAAQNLAIFGKTGSGKSSGSGDYILGGLVASGDTGGLWIASKPEDCDYARRLFREAGREGDLLIMEPGGEFLCNVLDYEQQHGADVRQLTQGLMTFGETLERVDGAGSGDRDPFFRRESRRMLHNGIEVVVGATGKLDPWDLQRFITGHAQNFAETGNEQWKQGFHCQTLEAAWQKTAAATAMAKHDFELARTYWLEEIPALNDRTRSSISVGAQGLLHVMNSGLARELLSTDTTISPEVLEQGKWWFVNLPITPGDATSTFINTAVKWVVQRHILRRKAGPDAPLIPIWCDEYQKIANGYDAAFLAECRSHKGCLIALTQSMHALYAALGGRGGEHETDALLTNFGHIVIHTLGDARSAEYASSLLGQRREVFIGTSSGEASMYDVVMRGEARVTVSVHEEYQPVLQPSVFLSGLRQGGPPDNCVDGVVIRAGDPFAATGENYLIRAFRQK